MATLSLTPEQHLIISALTARAIMWRSWRGELQYRIERATRADWSASWAQCPKTHDAMVRRLDQID